MNAYSLYMPHATLLAVAAAASITACGGGGAGVGASLGSAAMVTGYAATGLAIKDGKVTLKCTQGSTAPVTTAADGSYSVNISNVTLPCVARVDYLDPTSKVASKLHSLVKSAGNVNITPVTDMVVAQLNNGTAADAFDHFDSDKFNSQTLSTERIDTATQMVKTKLETRGVDTSKLPDDVIATAFTPTSASQTGDSHDTVLDQLSANLVEQSKDLTELENELSQGESSSGFATSTGAPTNATLGKALYTASCSGCHGSRISDATDYQKILRAIARNKGGMGSLTATIQTEQANDIATYMAYGASVVSQTSSQSIIFAAPADQTLGAAALPLSATASSGLPVTFSSATPSVCSLTSNVLTLLSSGTCSVTANQSGNASYAPATPVSVSLNVAGATGSVLRGQVISFNSPGAQTLGSAAPVLSATSSSGLVVSLSTTTPSVCSVSANALSLLAAGNCTLTANQTGNATFAAAVPASVSFEVVGAGAANGKLVYNQFINGMSCAACHGVPSNTSGGRLMFAANAPSVISTAITNNVGGMGMLNGRYSVAQIADIAAYLGTPGI